MRSMANLTASSSPSPTNPPYRDDPVNDEETQTQIAETINDSPSSAIPIPRSPDRDDNDLERGNDDDMAATLVNDDQPDTLSSSRRGWRGLVSLSLSAFSGEAAWRQAQADRNR